jgi:5-methyltetrahydrofolate--homocysteine methyltransferase
MNLLQIYTHVVEGNAAEVKADVQAAVEEGVSPDLILNQALVPAMDEVGRRFEEGEFYVPEMLIAARAMQSGLAILKPRLVESGIKSAGRVAIGTVKGDMHDIGKNLVAMMLEGAGFEVRDLGTEVTPQAYVQALQAAGLREQVKIIVGGAPLTAAFAQQIGADAFASDASSAVRVVRSLV